MSVAVVTGASAGIGAATARRLAREGFEVIAGARRTDRLEQLVAELGPPARAHALDVTDQASVDAFAAQVETCAVLVCNAGGALGLDPLPDITDEQWRTMWEVNVLGVVRTVRALLPALRASGDGRIVVVTSIAGHEVYVKGAGYTSAKHAVAAVTDTLRLELLAEPIRVIEIAPGMVQTEFSAVRFGGDEEKAAAVYEGVEPLTGDDIADAIAYAVTRPPHVTVARMHIFAGRQGGATAVAREES